MASLWTKVTKYLEANSKTWDAEENNIVLENNGSEDFIRTWNVSGLAKPTDDQIASYETAGNTAETLQGVLNKRELGYSKIGDQLDKLWHDIDDGKLDKNGSWYKAIKAVKDANPKG